MILNFGCGTENQTVQVPDENLLGVLKENPVPVGLTGETEVRRALAAPIGSAPLRQIVRPGEKIAIITSDITRPMPTAVVLPPLLEELDAAGVSREDITLVFALGSHRPHTEQERRQLAGEEAWNSIRCVDSDPGDCLLLGTTAAGTPVEITRVVAQADRRICLGNIEYHYFAGYSGGAKALMPGVSTRAAIQVNHAMMVRPECRAGALEDNPLRQDIEEAGRICGIDFIVNVVLDPHKQILRAVAGDAIAAHRAGCGFLDSVYSCPIREKADIVLVSQGGAPKDLNLYQTQKALDNAKHAVRDGGIIILIGSCREGFGESTFESWLRQARTSGELIERIGREFRLGGHKAAAIAMVLERAQIYLVSQMEPEFARTAFMTSKATAQQALEDAFAQLGTGATVWAMPCGGSTLPKIVI